MKSRSRRSPPKPPERARSPRAARRRNAIQPYICAGQRTRPANAAGRRPPFCEKHALSRIRRAGKRKCKNQSKAVFRPYPADRPLESGAAGKRARPPIRPACAGLLRTKAHGFSAVLTISRKAGRPSGGTVLLLPLSGGPVGVGTDMRAGATERFCLVLRCAPRRTIEINTRYTRGSAIEHQQLRQRVGPVRQSVRVCAQ